MAWTPTSGSRQISPAQSPFRFSQQQNSDPSSSSLDFLLGSSQLDRLFDVSNASQQLLPAEVSGMQSLPDAATGSGAALLPSSLAVHGDRSQQFFLHWAGLPPFPDVASNVGMPALSSPIQARLVHDSFTPTTVPPPSDNSSQQERIVLPRIELPNAKTAGTPKLSRHCCFLFSWDPNDRAQIVSKIREIVHEMCVVRTSSSRYGVHLIIEPTYFCNQDGVWVILTSTALSSKKWSEVAAYLSCVRFQIIFTRDSWQGKHGFEGLKELFNFTDKDLADVHANRVSCEKLPGTLTGRASRQQTVEQQGGSRKKRNASFVTSHDKTHDIEAADLQESDTPVKTKGDSKRRRKLNYEHAMPAQPVTPTDSSRTGRFLMVRGDMKQKKLHGGGEEEGMLEGHDDPDIASRSQEVDIASLVSSPFQAAGLRPALVSPSQPRVSSPTTAPGSLAAVCLNFFASKTTPAASMSFLQEVTKIVAKGDHLQGSGQNNLSFVLNSSLAAAYNRVVKLQTATLELLRNEPWCVPVESLTKIGIVEADGAWAAFRRRDEHAYNQIVSSLRRIIKTLEDTFNSFGLALFDPVSTSFFIAVHVLGRHRSDKTPLLFHAMKAMAQDMRSLYQIIYELSEFIRTWSSPDAITAEVQALLVRSDYASVEDFWTHELPPCLHEFLQEPFQGNQKRMIQARFKQLVAHARSFYPQIGGVSDAERTFYEMQGSMEIFRVLTCGQKLYALLCAAATDPEAMAPLRRGLDDSRTLV